MQELTVVVKDSFSGKPIQGARLAITHPKPASLGVTNQAGRHTWALDVGKYTISAEAFGLSAEQTIIVTEGTDAKCTLTLPLNAQLVAKNRMGRAVESVARDRKIWFEVQLADVTKWHCKWSISKSSMPVVEWQPGKSEKQREKTASVTVTEKEGGGASITLEKPFRVTFVQSDFTPAGVTNLVEDVKENLDEKLDQLSISVDTIADSIRAARPAQVVLQRSGATTGVSPHQALWVAIRNRTQAISFPNYERFIDRVLCLNTPVANPSYKALDDARAILGQALHGVRAYEVLRIATEAFLLRECGIAIWSPDDITNERLYEPQSEGDRLGLGGGPYTLVQAKDALKEYLAASGGYVPYIEEIVRNAFGDAPEGGMLCKDVVLAGRVNPCLLELIWSYWHEEGMLVQGINAVSLRFQNRRGPGGRNRLAHLTIAPLVPLNNLLWGYIQDEQHRLSVPRRAHEYDHEYGFQLFGRAAPTDRSADSRSKFLEAFHTLLRVTSAFYKEDDDTTKIADGFPALNALREVHLILAQGAHNQFGDLPWTARLEMLIQKWMLARPEMRDFLQSRPMVPYREGWMAQVDTLKILHGWTDTSVSYFHELAVYGEQLLLSIRYGNWVSITDPAQAANWARYWRAEVQGYIHAYRAVTGVDVGAEITAGIPTRELYQQPSLHLRRRLAAQQDNRP